MSARMLVDTRDEGDTTVVLVAYAVAGWVRKSRVKSLSPPWQALTARGSITRHWSRSEAISAVVDNVRPQ